MMSESLLRVLAVDAEFLIALDVQNTLSARTWCHVDVGTMRELEDLLKEAETPYDVVVFEADNLEDRLPELTSLIFSTGAAPVFGSLDGPPFAASKEGVDFSPVVTKPYGEKTLLSAFIAALEPVQPAKAREVTEAVWPSDA